MNTEKSELRRRILHRLKQAAAADFTGRRSAALRVLLQPYLAVNRELNIAIYAPLSHEANLMPLINEHPKHKFAFPRCLPGHRMSFHAIRHPHAELQVGAHGIPAPLPNLPEISPECLDIVIVPGVAFTLRGDRLGYGGGYYDRFLPLCTKARILAVALPEQLEQTLPTEKFDFRIPTILHAGITSAEL